MLTRARVALVRARFENWAVRSSLEGAARLAARSGVQPAPDKLFTMDEQADRELLCMPVSTPRAEAAKRVRDPLGAY